MTKLQKLEHAVDGLYQSADPNRDEWSDWLYANHVLVVADNAEMLAKRYHASVAQCRAAAVLHDIADATMSRFLPKHEETSMRIARELLDDTGFSQEEITTIVDDALRLHSCRNGQRPATLVGKILATADALAHLTTDYYLQTTQVLMKDRPPDQVQEWACKKIPRDYYEKIAFDDLRQEVKPYFESLQERFHL